MSKQRQLRSAAEMLRTMAHPTRLAILRELSRAPKCVTDIQDLVEVAQANVSQHLSALRREKIVDYHEDGKLRCYYIARPQLVKRLFVLIDGDHPAIWQSAEQVRRRARRRGAAIATTDSCSTDTPPAVAGSRATKSGAPRSVRRSTPPIAPANVDRTERTDRTAHWQQVYATKADPETSWFQEEATPSLDLVRAFAPKGGRIIDVGGGASVLGGRLVAEGFDATVLDISAGAIKRAKARIGKLARRAHWIVGDVTELGDIGTFDVWHDRAVFHFLVDAGDQRKYVALAARSVRRGGHLVVATFARTGPEKCSGLAVERYDATKLAAAFGPAFTLITSHEETHVTPWGKPQAFLFAVMQRTSKRS
ncbi:MAG: metalloregulator ArsR/SmtB family transcription factor [Phycisphaerae bacterium]|nr:metalloregulator ArsR/SmtB family transcription factor [Phycisphaerae bacterium]